MLKIIDQSPFLNSLGKIKVQPALLSQAVRVYLANQRQGTQSALTRAEVDRTGKKVFKQKGTGHARHGSRRAPIYVGGGVTFAPKPRDHALSLTAKMRELAKIQALATAAKDDRLKVVTGLEDLSGKTKEFSSFLRPLDLQKGKNFLVVTDKLRENVYRASKNVPGVTVLPVEQLTAYHLLSSAKILFMEDCVKAFPSLQKKVEESRSIGRAKSVKRRKKSK